MFFVASDAAHGSASVDGTGFVTYQSNADYAGADSFDVEVDDNAGGSTLAHVTVQVVDAAPACDPVELGDVPRGQTAFGTASCTDPDGDGITYTVTDPPHGTAEIDEIGGGIDYTPDAGYAGPDSFTYSAADAVGPSAAASVTVNVTNTAPRVQRRPADAAYREADQAVRLLRGRRGRRPDRHREHAAEPRHAERVHVRLGRVLLRRHVHAGRRVHGRRLVRVPRLRRPRELSSGDLRPERDGQPRTECGQNGTHHTKVGAALLVFVSCSDQDTQDQEDLTYSIVPAVRARPRIAERADRVRLRVGHVHAQPGLQRRGRLRRTRERRRPQRRRAGAAARRRHAAVHAPPRRSRSAPAARTRSTWTAPCRLATSPRSSTRSSPARPRARSPGKARSGPTSRTPAPSGPTRCPSARAATQGESPIVVRRRSRSAPTINHPPECDTSFGGQTVYPGGPRGLFIDCDRPDNDFPITFATHGQPAHGTSTASNGVITYTAAAAYTGADTVPFTATDGHGARSTAAGRSTVAPPEAPKCGSDPIEVTVRPGRTRDASRCSASTRRATRRRSAPRRRPRRARWATSARTATSTTPPRRGPERHRHVHPARRQRRRAQRAGDRHGHDRPELQPRAVVSAFARAKSRGDRRDAARLRRRLLRPRRRPLDFTRASQPVSGGTVSAGPAATLTYTPPHGFLGADWFTFFATDSRGVDLAATSDSSTSSQRLAPTCTGPTGDLAAPGPVAQHVRRLHGPGSGAITYKIVSAPAIGSLCAERGLDARPSRFYTAGAAAGTARSRSARAAPAATAPTYTQTITVDPSANQLPIVPAQRGLAAAVVQGRATTLALARRCYDPDGDPLTFTRVLPDPQHGTATAAAAAITYTSAAGFTGADADRLHRVRRPRRHRHADLHRQRRPGGRADVRAPRARSPCARAAPSALFFDCDDTFGSPLTYDDRHAARARHARSRRRRRPILARVPRRRRRGHRHVHLPRHERERHVEHGHADRSRSTPPPTRTRTASPTPASRRRPRRSAAHARPVLLRRRRRSADATRS